MFDFLSLASITMTFGSSGMSGKIIIFVLIIGSMYAWTVMTLKLRQLDVARKSTERFIKAYRKEGHPAGLFVRRTRFSGCPAYEIYEQVCNALGNIFLLSGVDENDLFMSGLGTDNKLSRAEAESLRGLAERTMAEQILKLEHQMGTIASAATTAPFLGLLGTVLGVMSAFSGMAVTGSAMLSAVAPGISSALLTTVVGLLVALPSSIGYNILNDKIRALNVGMDNFVQELSSDIELNYLDEK